MSANSENSEDSNNFYSKPEVLGKWISLIPVSQKIRDRKHEVILEF